MLRELPLRSLRLPHKLHYQTLGQVIGPSSTLARRCRFYGLVVPPQSYENFEDYTCGGGTPMPRR